MVDHRSVIAFVLLTAFTFLAQAQSFSLYPTVNPDNLAAGLNISYECLDTLNTTLPCDNYLFGWTVNVDDYFWSEENVTQLCTSECAAAAQTWEQNAALACVDDDLVVFGSLVPAFSVAGRYVDGYGIACLQSSTLDWCMIESLSWTGSDVVRPDCSIDPTHQQCLNPTNVTAENQRLANLYNDTLLCSDCFVNMLYQRITSDYLPDSDYSDYLVAEFQDIQDVCSTTIAANISTRPIWNLPTAFPTAITNSSTDNSTTASTITSAASTSSAAASSVTSLPSSISTGHTITTPTPTQSGMVAECTAFYEVVSGDICYNISAEYNITLTDFEAWNPAVGANCSTLWADTYYCVGVALDTDSSACQMIDLSVGVDTSNATLACAELSILYGVTTGDLYQYTGGSDCFSSDDVCLPAACNLMQVPNNASCASLATLLTANSTIGNITTTQLLSWNPNIIGTCDALEAGQYICMNAPGGSYIPPPNPTGAVNAGGQERGGPGGADPTAITGTTVSQIITSQPLGVNPTAAPAPTQLGIISTCNQYSQAKSGDDCTTFASENSVSPDDLYTWNTQLGTDGANCNTELWIGYYYCIGVTGGTITTATVSSSTASPSVTSSTSVAIPSPTQSGIISTCNKYASAPSGSYCSLFASTENITLSDLYAWNAILGTDGANCGTEFFADEYYCVGVSSSSTTTSSSSPSSTSTTSSSIPSPTQSGIISTCDKYAAAPSGSYCSLFATTESISLSELYAWNTILGSDGANCGTAFFADYYYCVGIATPSPIQTGIISTCNNYAIAPSGSYCSLFASDEGITLDDLYTWNTILGTDGANCGTEFFADYYYCIGISS